jgi:hypothetical protein
LAKHQLMPRIRFLLLSLLMALTGFTADDARPWEKVGAFVEAATLQPMEATEEAVERLMVAEIGALDPSLSDEPFEAWFDALMPSGTGRFFELTACPETGEDPEGSAGSRRPVCLALEVEVVSRNRALRLWFERESLAFLGGKVFSPELDSERDVPSLSALPALLKKGFRYLPLKCPPEAELKLREEYAGLFEWCEDAEGRKQGPYRSWFSTGHYLMERGRYEDDGKTGEWIECNRFERCAFKTYARGNTKG